MQLSVPFSWRPVVSGASEDASATADLGAFGMNTPMCCVLRRQHSEDAQRMLSEKASTVYTSLARGWRRALEDTGKAFCFKYHCPPSLSSGGPHAR